MLGIGLTLPERLANTTSPLLVALAKNVFVGSLSFF